MLSTEEIAAAAAELLARTRAAQGLPAIPDAAVLDQVAEIMVIDGDSVL